MIRFVEISFDCLPLRSVDRLDAPIDASPAFRARCERILSAIQAHGSHNTYYLYNADCVFHLTNDPEFGRLEFEFDGTVFTDEIDQHAERCALDVRLTRETCDWLTEPIVEWFKETVGRAVRVEFDHYIAAGDLRQTVERIQRLQAETDSSEGFLGMYL